MKVIAYLDGSAIKFGTARRTLMICYECEVLWAETHSSACWVCGGFGGRTIYKITHNYFNSPVMSV
jgi:hypothetical protein